MDRDDQRPSVVLRGLVNGYQVTQAIHVAAVLGIADLLADGPRRQRRPRRGHRDPPRALYRLLRALAGVGVFREEEDRHFALTELGACLRADAPEPVGGRAAFVGEPSHWQAWSALLHSVRTGENAFRHVHGMRRLDLPGAPPRAERQLRSRDDRPVAAGGRPRSWRPTTSAASRRSSTSAGGHGAFLAAILAKHPGVRRRALRPAARRRRRRADPGGGGRGRPLPGRRRELLRGRPGRGRRLHPQGDPPRLGGRGGGRDPADCRRAMGRTGRCWSSSARSARRTRGPRGSSWISK